MAFLGSNQFGEIQKAGARLICQNLAILQKEILQWIVPPIFDAKRYGVPDLHRRLRSHQLHEGLFTERSQRWHALASEIQNGYAISAKRYAIYQRTKNNLTIIDPKAHGLGYQYPPKARTSEDESDWTFEAWEALLREALDLPRTTPT